MQPSLFAKHQESPQGSASPLPERLIDAASRLAVLEERASNLRKKTQMTEQSLIEYEQGTRADLRALTERLTELARKVEEVHEKIEAMSGELSSVVKKNELHVLERYMDLWQPLSFVTRDEAKILIAEALASRDPAPAAPRRARDKI